MATSKINNSSIRVAVIRVNMTANAGASAQTVSLSNHTDVVPASATVLNAFPIASQSPAWVSVNGAYNSVNNYIEVGLYNHYTQPLSGVVTILVLYTA